MFLSACSLAANPLLKNRKKDKAMEAYKQGNYSAALSIWSSSIAKYESRHKERKCSVYTLAGIAAYRLNKTDQARNYFEHARNGISENAQTFWYLAKIYRKIDNLSLEIDALENYLKKYPHGTNIQQVKKRLLFTYVESENWDNFLNLWKIIPASSKDSLTYQQAFLSAQAGLNHVGKADSVATSILKVYPEDRPAMAWKANKYYTLAENLYESEMKAYKKHKTRAQYARLLKAFDVVSANFKRALIYYRKLYKMHPTTLFANRLGTIYMRMDEKPKAQYYLQMAKKLKN